MLASVLRDQGEWLTLGWVPALLLPSVSTRISPHFSIFVSTSDLIERKGFMF